MAAATSAAAAAAAAGPAGVEPGPRLREAGRRKGARPACSGGPRRHAPACRRCAAAMGAARGRPAASARGAAAERMGRAARSRPGPGPRRRHRAAAAANRRAVSRAVGRTF